jgi:GT2 family glycosyltransferase
MPKIGIVTVLYKSDAVLDDFFKSISCQNYTNYILYIIDNSPTPESKQLVFEYSSKYKILNHIVYLPSEDNIGVAAGNNVGILAAQKDNCEYVLLSNNDILIQDEDLFGNMISEIESKKIKILIPKIHFYDSNEIWFISGYINKFRAKCFHTNNYKVDNGQFDYLTECTYAPTCFMLFHKSVFEKIGLMDEKYFVYYDDTDFLWRCHINNIQINIYTNAVIEHKEGKSTGGQTSDFSFYYFTRNRFYFASKIHQNRVIKWLSFGYIFLVSLLRSIKYKKTRIYFNILKEFLNKEEFKRQNKF